MLIYLTRRIIGMIPLFLGITFLSFFVIHLAPGKPGELMNELNPKISLEVRQRIEKLYDLDKPLGVQYGHWLKRLLHFDFGSSFSDGRPVSEKFLETIPVTLAINGLSLVLILIFGIPFGILSALKKDSFFDKVSSGVVFILIAAPTFWLALILMDCLGVKAGWFPVSGLRSLDYEYFNWWEKIKDLMRHLALPVFVSSLGGWAVFSRYMRQSMLEVLDKKYMAAAVSRGLSEKTVFFKHGLRNALLPLITILGLSIPGLIGGSVIFETIFSIPGTGRLFFTAVMARDYPVIMAMLVLSAMLTLLGNLLADVGYALVDPRIRYQSKK